MDLARRGDKVGRNVHGGEFFRCFVHDELFHGFADVADGMPRLRRTRYRIFLPQSGSCGLVLLGLQSFPCASRAAKKGGVHNVHTLPAILGRNSVGLPRRMFSGEWRILGLWNAIRVPPRAQCFRRSAGRLVAERGQNVDGRAPSGAFFRLRLCLAFLGCRGFAILLLHGRAGVVLHDFCLIGGWVRNPETVRQCHPVGDSFPALVRRLCDEGDATAAG